MSQLRVIVVDNLADQLKSLRPAVEKLLHVVGYDAIVHDVHLEDAKDDKQRSKVVDLMNERPDIVFFDNNFGKTPELATWGFNFIAHIKADHPDTVFVLMTGHPTSNEFSKAFPHPDIVASKIGILNAADSERIETYRPQAQNKFVKFFRDSLRRQFRRTKLERLLISADVRRAIQGLKCETGRKSPMTDDELRSLIEQVCYMDKSGSENRLDEARLELLEGGKSDAVVCTVSLSSNNQPYNVPGVVKISTVESADNEFLNHSRYVKWVLPYAWRVDVIGRGSTGRFGAVCYSFAHGGNELPISLSQSIRGGNITQVLAVLLAVLDPSRQTWYSQRRIDPDGRDLGAYLSVALPYLSRDSRITKAESLQTTLLGLAKTEKVKLIGGNTKLLQVGDRTLDLAILEERIFSHTWGILAEECICHGDMNAGNIMVRPDTADFCFIDFRHTGWHHRARDFCSLEGAICTLMRLPKEEDTLDRGIEREATRVLTEEAEIQRDPQQFLGRCVESLRANSSPTVLISVIRSLFLLNFPGSTLREYYLAQLVHTWWLLSFEKEWHDFQRQRLAANFLALFSAIIKDLE